MGRKEWEDIVNWYVFSSSDDAETQKLRLGRAAQPNHNQRLKAAGGSEVSVLAAQPVTGWHTAANAVAVTLAAGFLCGLATGLDFGFDLDLAFDFGLSAHSANTVSHNF